MPTPTLLLKADAAEITRAIHTLFRPGDVIELRIPRTERDGTISGYFQDHQALAAALASLNGKAAGVYVTLNPVKPDLLARAVNRIQLRARTTTGDSDIACRRWLLVDCDVVRPADISATDAEHAAALERARDIRMALAEEGWPQPVLADSGNGAHPLYRIDLPNDDASRILLEGVLKALAARFNDARVKIDQSVYNAARIVKAYGTVAAKGDHTPDRPHRLSRILDVPSVLEPVPLELLRALAPKPAPPSQPRPQDHSHFQIDAFVARNLKARDPVAHKGGRKWVLEECPFNPEHTAPDAAVFERANGSLAFKCFHNSCAGKGWRDVRALFEGPRNTRSAGVPQETAIVAADAFPATIENLNAMAVFHGRIQWASISRRGSMTLGGTVQKQQVIWPTVSDLISFAKARAYIAEATNVLLPQPPKNQVSAFWDPAASMILRLAARDTVKVDHTWKSECRDLLRLMYRYASTPVAKNSKEFMQYLIAIKKAVRNREAPAPPCVFVAEEQCWVHEPTFRNWLSISSLTNTRYPQNDIRNGLMLLGFVSEEDVTRGGDGDSESLCLWRGPLDVLLE